MSVAKEIKAAAFSATLCAAALIAHQVAAKAARDALFLTSFDVTQLPRMVVISAVISVLVVIGSTRAMLRYSPARVVPRAFLVSAALLLLQWGLFPRSPSAITVTFYLHTIVFGSVLTSGFWSMVNERFDPHSAKRLVGRIAAGGTIGALLGGICAERIGANLSLVLSFPFLALLHLFCGWIVRDLRVRQPKQKRKKQADVEGGLAVLRGSSYLRNMALLVTFGTASAGLIDYVVKAEASATFSSGEDLVRFFAAFYAGVGLVSFVLQTTLTARILERLGIGRSVASLPLISGLGATLSIFFPGLISIAATRGTEGMLRASLYRSAYELLYTPVAPSQKRATKSIIDVLCDRLGDVIGGALVAVVLALVVPAQARVWLLGASALLSVVGLVVATRLQRGYVQALERSLLALGDALVGTREDGTPLLRRVVQPTEYLLFDRQEGAFLAPDPEHILTATGMTMELSKHHAISLPAASLMIEADERLAFLNSSEPTKIRFALKSAELTPALVPQAIDLLAMNVVLPDVLHALRRVAEREVDTLVEALLDQTQDFAVRRRVPRVLEVCDHPNAIEGLLAGLSDPRFEVRFRCGRALTRHRGAPQLSTERLLEAVDREVEVEPGLWASRELLDGQDDDDESFADQLLVDRANRSIEHVFRMLSLIYPEDPIRVAYRGLFVEDANLRGTAIEYLDSVLPEATRDRLFPLVGASTVQRPRPSESILEALMQSSHSIMANLEELQAAHRNESEDLASGRPGSTERTTEGDRGD